jgi:hypothetical protein
VKPSHKAALALVLIAVFATTGGLAYYLHFYRHKTTLTEQLAESQSAIEGFQVWLDDRASTDDRLNRVAATTLGFDAENVESRFRSGLNRMATSAGLVEDDTVVTKPMVGDVKNPTVESRPIVAEFKGQQKEDYITAPDLYTMSATIRGTGTFDSVVRLLALAQSQPWIWSVNGFTLKPKDDQATLFDITVEVTTVLLPDLAPPEAADGGDARSEAEPPPIRDPSADRILATSAIVTRNVFAPPVPTPPEVIATTNGSGDGEITPGAETSPKPPPPPPPYHEWRLTGLSGSQSQGKLAWMLNARTGAAVLLSPGQGVLDAVLVRAEGDGAVFQIGDGRFELSLNETLANRRAVK